MIRLPTLLILGAGASVPYGFPTGAGLRTHICGDLHERSSSMYRELSAAGYTEAAIKAFRDTFWLSQKQSIDAFLEHRPEYLDIGKAAIAAALIPSESPDTLFNTGDWYQYLYLSMNSTFEEFDKNKLSILTYNYDRSLEHFLFTALKNSYGKTDEECIEKVASVPIIHLHGQLGPLWPFNEKGRPYQTDRNPDNIRLAKGGIKIIHEDIGNQPQFSRAFACIADAQRICFLGFGYDKINLKRIFNAENWSNKAVYGSAYGFTETEQAAIKRRFDHKITLGHRLSANFEFLRELAFFSEE